jgi:protein-disulfide isomerase
MEDQEDHEDKHESHNHEPKHEHNHEHKPEVKRDESVQHKVDHHMGSSKKELTQRMRENPWMLATIVLGVVVLISLFNGGGGVAGNVISADVAGEKLLTYYQANGAEGITLDSVDEESGFYIVNFAYQGSIIPIHMTKDGNLAGSLTPLSGAVGASTGVGGSGPAANVVEIDLEDDAVKGDANAPVTIVEFSDYECPFCGRHFDDTLPSIISEYVDTGKVKIVFMDFPLNFHPNAQKAGEAAECAGEQGKYWEMHDVLFENQQSLGVSSLKQYAKDIGLDSGKFDSCLDSGDQADEVSGDLSAGQGYGVSGTPANFVNGKLVSGACPFSAFQDAIEAELEGNEWSISNCRVSVL